MKTKGHPERTSRQPHAGSRGHTRPRSGLHNSPYLQTQRRQIDQCFGGAPVQAKPSSAPLTPSAGVVQRDIRLKGLKLGQAVGWWANRYIDVRGEVHSFATLRWAFKKIEDAPEESTDCYEAESEVFDRAEQFIEGNKERAISPIWRETSPTKVWFELNFHIEECDPLPSMELLRTYASNWDNNGGFGGEYWATNKEGDQKWVIHVHRGPNGGLKSARIKAWSTRGEGHNGVTMFKFDHLAKIGIPNVDNRRIE